MKQVEINKSIRLSEHFTLGEVTKTSHQTADGNYIRIKEIPALK